MKDKRVGTVWENKQYNSTVTITKVGAVTGIITFVDSETSEEFKLGWINFKQEYDPIQ